MRFLRPWLLLPLCFALGGASAPFESVPTQRSGKECWFGVRFQDDSNIRVALVPARLSITTAYGRLVVPAGDVRRIEFGHRFPDGAERRIRAAITLLGSPTYAEREKASKELLALGPHSYRPLQTAVQGSDLELVRRARDLIAKLERIFSRGQLEPDLDDRIHTARFLIIGRLDGSQLEVQTVYFGPAKLKLTDLKEMHAQGNAAGQALTIDAGRYAAPAIAWLDTGVSIQRGRTLKIRATGQIDMYPLGGYIGQYMATPAGPKWPGGGMVGGHRSGALMGRIGQHGQEFVIGESYDGAAGEGKLYLRIVPSPWNNQSTGEYRVTVGQN